MELDLDAIEARKSGPAGSENWMLVYLTVPERDALVAEARRLRAENGDLRGLLAEALPWIDPNDRHEDYLLTIAISEALEAAP